ncbi:MAG: carboxymuconolactone decarboxylase family protein [Alphaproteobacteria bacterium]|nr:carboxymuconolactone decarboxylase family protein [Alphaproteobacteria bacterium]
MARIAPNQNPTPEAQEKLNGIKAKLGIIPNIFQTFAHSPAVLDFYMQGSGALGKTSISAQLRESIALTVAGLNGCDYCASAHTKIGEGAGLKADELARNLNAQSGDVKTQAALDFSAKLVNKRGNVSDDDIQAVKDAGYNEGEVLEITTVVAFNIFTNFFNHVADTDVDFPHVSTAQVKKVA